mgnify:CR=1 FL=1
MALPQLKSKQYKVEVFTPQFLLSGTLEPVGSLMPYLNNADRNNLLLKQVSSTPIEPATSLPTFAAEELWLPRKELIAIKFLDAISSDTMPLLTNKEKVRVFLPHIVRIARAVFGAEDPKKKVLKPQTVIEGGVLAEDCGALLKDFFAARR